MTVLTVSIADAQRALGVGKTTVYKAINAGQLRTVKFGRRRLVLADSIRELVG